MCGIASLGAYLTKLQSLSLEGNVIVDQVTKSGGKLGFLLANFFPSLSSNTPAAGRNENEFLVSRSTVANVQLAIQQRDEDALLAFLKTGSAVPQSESEGSMTRKADVASRVQSSRFKVEELALPQSSVVVAAAPALVSNAPPKTNRDAVDPLAATTAAISPTALSKESKMEMWNRITEERKAAQEKEKERLQRELAVTQPVTTAETKQPRSGEVMVSPIMVAVQAPVLPVKLQSAQAQRATEDSSMKSRAQPPPPPLPPSPPAAPTQPEDPPKQDRGSGVTATKKPQATAQEYRSGAGGEPESSLSLAGQVKVLSEQVATMRKYMKVSSEV